MDFGLAMDYGFSMDYGVPMEYGVPMDYGLMGFLLTTATTHAAHMTSSFNLFLTVLFGSLAFAAALPMRSIGKPVSIGRLRCSLSSLWFAAALLAFYIIDFVAFQSAANGLDIVLGEMYQQLSCSMFKNCATLSVFQPQKPFIGNLPLIGNLHLSGIGFLIGSSFSWVLFLWISNVDRSKKITSDPAPSGPSAFRKRWLKASRLDFRR